MYRNLARFLMLAVMASPAAFGQTAAPATAAGATKIGIINIQAAILATNEGKRDFETLQKKFEPKQTELAGLNKEVEDMKKQLSTQGDKMNDDARASLVKNIESKQKSLQRSFEDAQGDFQAQQNDLANRIGGKLMQVLDSYAKQNNFSLIMDVSSPQSPVLWAGATVDVTKDVVDAFNANPPTTSSAAPAAAPAAAKPTGAPAAAKPPAAKPATPAPAAGR